jgi:hypothetical protein
MSKIIHLWLGFAHGGGVEVALSVKKIHLGLALASEGGREALAASNVETNLPTAHFCTRECGRATSAVHNNLLKSRLVGV